MTDTILVVDVGTSSARGILYEPDGKKRFSARVSYTPVRDDQSSEISPRVLSDAFVSVIKQCADYARLSGLSILCLSLTAQRSSFLPVDADGAPLTNFMDGFELTKQLREAGMEIPILMVTAKQAITDKKRGFALGADDYMTKPVDEEEMLMRIGALLRRAKIAADRKLTVGGTTLYYDSFTVVTDDVALELPRKEFLLLYKLLSYSNKIFTRRQLMCMLVPADRYQHFGNSIFIKTDDRPMIMRRDLRAEFFLADCIRFRFDIPCL